MAVSVKLTDTQPVIVGLTPAFLVSVILGGLQVFNVWSPSVEQNEWIYSALIPLLIALGAWFSAHHVWSPASHAAVVNAVRAGRPEELAAPPVRDPLGLPLDPHRVGGRDEPFSEEGARR